MTKMEVASMFDFIESVNPQFNIGLGEEKRHAATKAWAEMLEGYTPESCMAAVKAFVSESPYPPKICDIIERIRGSAQTSVRGKWLVTDWERRSLRRMKAWCEAHERKLHSQGKLTAVECKKRGMTFSDYCDQFVAAARASNMHYRTEGIA